jgi:hypothetical protein
MSGVKDIAKRVAAAAAERKVRFPKIWDESQILQACGTTLVSYHESFAHPSVVSLTQRYHDSCLIHSCYIKTGPAMMKRQLLMI